MRVVIAPDSFKECLDARHVADAIAKGVRRAWPNANVRCCPLADGGEGTAATLGSAWGARLVARTVRGPLDAPVKAHFAYIEKTRTAIVEMAQASGLALLIPAKRNPLKTSTYGTGELIRAALDCGAHRLIIGIGGSATVDGGTGMARALGVRFLDPSGCDVPEGGGHMGRIDRIVMDGLDPRLDEVHVEVACDVDNPLCGPRGAARTFGPQKGATPDVVETLENGLRHLARIIRRDVGSSVLRLNGAGAAGGLGAGLVAFLNAQLRSGIELIAEAMGLEAAIREADLVITGEGRIDGQTIGGKAPAGVARIAQRYGVPVVALCGAIDGDTAPLAHEGISAALDIVEEPMPLEEAIAQAPALLQRAGFRVAQLIGCGQRIGRSLDYSKRKIVGIEKLSQVCASLRCQGKTVAWTNGCFDILHPGHILYLGQACREADALVVGLNSDHSIRTIKGPGRPVNEETHRAAMLSELSSVDYVVVFDEPSPLAIIERVKPDVYIKGGDYTLDTLNQDERRLVEGYGGRIALTSAIEGASTTGIIQRIKSGT